MCEKQLLVLRMRAFVILTIFLLLQSSVWATDPPPEEPSGVEESESVPHKSGYQAKDIGFNGPSSVRAQLEDDDVLKDPVFRFPHIDRALKPWLDFKHRVNQAIGLQFGFDYNILSQWLNDSLTDEDHAAVGVFRAYGSWTLLGRGTGHPWHIGLEGGSSPHDRIVFGAFCPRVAGRVYRPNRGRYSAKRIGCWWI